MRPRKPWFREGRGWFVTINGRQTFLAAGPESEETRKAAEIKFHELMLECLSNPPVDGGDPTVASVIEAFLEYASKRDAESTFYERKLYLQKFADVHGGRLVRDCKAFHLTSWVDAHPSWESEWTKSYAIRNVKRPFNWAVRQGLIPHNPFAAVEHRAGNRRRPIAKAEFKKLLSAAPPKSGLVEVLRFAIWSGARPCEMRALRWTDVDLKGRVIRLFKHKTSRTQRDSNKPRNIVLIPQAVSLLSKLRRRHPGSEFVFLSSRRKPWRRCSLQQAVRRLRRSVNLPDDAVLYGIRHFWGTNSVLSGNDVKTTAELMGHSSTRMTEHYLHLAGETKHLSAAAKRAAKSVASV